MTPKAVQYSFLSSYGKIDALIKKRVNSISGILMRESRNLFKPSSFKLKVRPFYIGVNFQVRIKSTLIFLIDLTHQSSHLKSWNKNLIRHNCSIKVNKIKFSPLSSG